MQMVNMTCPSCGAKLEIDEATQHVTCDYCGNRFILDANDTLVQNNYTEEAGYRFEAGRIRAQEEQRKKVESAINNEQKVEARFSCIKKYKWGIAEVILGALFILAGLFAQTDFLIFMFIGTVFAATADGNATAIRKLNAQYGLNLRYHSVLVAASCTIVLVAIIGVVVKLV